MTTVESVCQLWIALCDSVRTSIWRTALSHNNNHVLAKWPHTPREEEKRRGAMEGYICRPMINVFVLRAMKGLSDKSIHCSAEKQFAVQEFLKPNDVELRLGGLSA